MLIITNGERWQYIAWKSERADDRFNRPITSLSRLFRGITLNHHGDFYCLNCLRSFRTDKTLKRHERLCDNNNYCDVEVPTKNNNKLNYNLGVKSWKMPFVIDADLECLWINQQSCQNNPNESDTKIKAMHEPCGYTLDLVSSFDWKQKKHRLYRGKDCIKRFCIDLKELATKIINCEQEEMIPLTDNKNKFYEEEKNVTYEKESFFMIKMIKRNLNYTKKLEIIVIIQKNLEELLIAFVL